MVDEVPETIRGELLLGLARHCRVAVVVVGVAVQQVVEPRVPQEQPGLGLDGGEAILKRQIEDIGVGEVPKPRWSTIEAFRFGVAIPERVPVYAATRLHLTGLVHAANQTENYL